MANDEEWETYLDTENELYSDIMSFADGSDQESTRQEWVQRLRDASDLTKDIYWRKLMADILFAFIVEDNEEEDVSPETLMDFKKMILIGLEAGLDGNKLLDRIFIRGARIRPRAEELYNTRIYYLIRRWIRPWQRERELEEERRRDEVERSLNRHLTRVGADGSRYYPSGVEDIVKRYMSWGRRAGSPKKSPRKRKGSKKSPRKRKGSR